MVIFHFFYIFFLFTLKRSPFTAHHTLECSFLVPQIILVSLLLVATGAATGAVTVLVAITVAIACYSSYSKKILVAEWHNIIIIEVIWRHFNYFFVFFISLIY